MVNKGQGITPNYTCAEEDGNVTVVYRFDLPNYSCQNSQNPTESKVQNSF
jgi:hypothetical protein